MEQPPEWRGVYKIKKVGENTELNFDIKEGGLLNKPPSKIILVPYKSGTHYTVKGTYQ